MTLETAIQERIMGLCRERGLSAHSLAMLCRIPSSTMQHIFSRETSTPCISTIEEICDGLGISLADFFVDDLFHNLEHS